MSKKLTSFLVAPNFENDIIAYMSSNTVNSKIDYDKNLSKLLGRHSSRLDILEKSYGILKGKLKISSVAWQRKIRREWETRLKRQYKIASKKSV